MCFTDSEHALFRPIQVLPSDNLLEVKINTSVCVSEMSEGVPNNLTQTLRTERNITHVVLEFSRLKSYPEARQS